MASQPFAFEAGRVRRALRAGALGLALAGCSGVAQEPEPAVAVAGPATELTALAGEWSGQYWSPVTGRSGCIHFRLDASSAAAWGEVTMFPATVEHGVVGEAHEAAGRQHAARQLTIRFVRLADGRVTGNLDPYPDPECGCLLSTTFEGRVDGGVIAGDYVARAGGAHPHTSGSWRVERVPAGDQPCPDAPEPQRP